MIERLLAAERALADGEVDRAERLFRQVVDADDRNAIAVVGLAEVALARGDLAAAEALAARALTIDPEDAAAARLLAAPSPTSAPSAALGPTSGPALAAPTGPGTTGAAPAGGSPRSLPARIGAWLARLLGRSG